MHSPMLSPRIQHAIPPHSTRFQYAFPSLRGPLVVGGRRQGRVAQNGFTGRARTPCAPPAPADARNCEGARQPPPARNGVHALPCGLRATWATRPSGVPNFNPLLPRFGGAVYKPCCTHLVRALYRPCTRSVHAMLTGCTRSVQALYSLCTGLARVRPHSKLRVQGSRFKARGCAPPAIYHPPCSVAALPRWALCGQRRLCVALGCPCLEFTLQAVGDSGPVGMAFSADFGARAGWHGVGMATEAPRLRRGSPGYPGGIPRTVISPPKRKNPSNRPNQRMNRTP